MAWWIAAAVLIALAWWLLRRPGASAGDGAWWQGLMSEADWQRFLQLVSADAAIRFPGSRLEDGVVHTADGQQCGLQNLAQRCAQAEAGEWPAMVSEHFGHLQSAQAAADDLESRAAVYEQVADLLALRLYPADFVDGPAGTTVVSRRDLEGTATVLVYDLPTTVQTVPRQHVEAWGLGEDVVFARALANLARLPVERGEHDLGQGVVLHLFAGDHFFVASQALRLDQFRDSLGREGALVAVPHRHALVVYPIDSLAVTAAVGQLAGIATGMEREGPGSITANIYWYRHGRFHLLPYTLDAGKLQLQSPPAFTAMLERLAGEAE